MFQTLARNAGCRGVRLILIVAPLFSVSASHAQTTHDHALMSSPSTAAATALKFESTMLRYKPMTDQKPGSWRDANDTVNRIGGWRSYLKEAQEPDAKPAVAPASPVEPFTAAPAAPNPHAGHGVKP